MTIASLLLVGCGGGGGGGSSSGSNTNGGSTNGGSTNNQVLSFSVNKTAIDFGSTVVGQTVPGSMTVSNTGNTALDVQASLSGDGAFGALDVPAACTGLAAGADCVINVAFEPAAEGDFTGSVSISAAGATGASVSLAGRGQELNVQITSVGQSCNNPLAATVSVTDATGAPVGMLLQNYFSAFLSDSATASNLLTWSEVPTRKPFALMLAVDWSGSTEAIRSSIVDATDSFVDALLPDDKVGLIRFARDIEVASPLVLADATGKDQLKAAVRTEFPFGTASSRVWDAVNRSRQIVDDESETDYTRVVILLTDGVEVGSQIGGGLDEVIARAQAANTLVYTVGFEGTDGFNLEDLRELSDATGALAFQSSDGSELQQFYASISESLTGLYDLTIDNPSTNATALRVAVDTGMQTGADDRPITACP